MIQITKGEIKTEAGYFGKGETAELPPDEEKRLIAAGRAEQVYSVAGFPDKADDDAPDELEQMTMSELRAYAQAEGIDLKGATAKAAILEIIRAAAPRG